MKLNSCPPSPRVLNLPMGSTATKFPPHLWLHPWTTKLPIK